MENTGKVGGVIVSHGQVANELLAAAEAVVGDLSNITAVSIGWHDDVETARDEIARAIKNMSFGSGVLLLTDMFGGTPRQVGYASTGPFVAGFCDWLARQMAEEEVR